MNDNSDFKPEMVSNKTLIGSSSGEPHVPIDFASSQSLLTRRPNDASHPGRENQYPNRDCQRGARSLYSLVGNGERGHYLVWSVRVKG